MKKIIRFFKTFFQYQKENQRLKKQILKLQGETRYDSSTLAYNRRYLKEIGKKEFERAKRYKLSFTLIFLDMDKLKEINDQQGHIAGDEAIKTVASLLLNSSRESDLVFRYGGDEFLVIMPETKKEEAKQFMDRINQELSYTPLRISFGIATLKNESSLEMLIAKTDCRMYMAKVAKNV